MVQIGRMEEKEMKENENLFDLFWYMFIVVRLVNLDTKVICVLYIWCITTLKNDSMETITIFIAFNKYIFLYKKSDALQFFYWIS